MHTAERTAAWLEEERSAQIHGWDFSHISGRYEGCTDLPWDYRQIIQQHLRPDMNLLDYDTGGGEFLLALQHPHDKTAATEGFPPNIKLCKDVLLPLGINFRACSDPENIPFPDESFDMIINRHGDLCPGETYRLLKKGGIFITQQVGSDNDRDLVELVLPGIRPPFPDMNLKTQKKAFETAGFQMLEDGEAYSPIRFFDVGAFVWFARIIPWEFPGFSVENCLPQLLNMQKIIDESGFVEGTAHRYLMVAKKPL